MRRFGQRRLLLTTGLALLAMAGPGIGQAQQPAKDRIHAVTGKGETLLQPDGWFVGKATFIINGQTVSVTSRAMMLSEDALDDGKIQAVTTHIFDFGGGNTVQTLDQALMTPAETAGKYRLQSVLKITRGTGIYKNAFGRLAGPGGYIYFNEAQPRAQWEMTGTIVLDVPTQ